METQACPGGNHGWSHWENISVVPLLNIKGNLVSFSLSPPWKVTDFQRGEIWLQPAVSVLCHLWAILHCLLLCEVRVFDVSPSFSSISPVPLPCPGLHLSLRCSRGPLKYLCFTQNCCDGVRHTQEKTTISQPFLADPFLCFLELLSQTYIDRWHSCSH
jgi:hypothetical protein